MQNNDKPNDLCALSSNYLKDLSLHFSKKKYDFLVISGDRYEIFVTAYVATLHKIPIIHLFGGDETIGSYDNQFRHSISKMSHIHFVSHVSSKNRLIKMGENPNSIFNIGNLSLDNIKSKPFLSKKQLENKYNIKFKQKNFLVTFHTETLSKDKPISHLKKIFKALSKFKNYSFIFTSSNNDEGGNKINKHIPRYIKKNTNTYYVKSFGQKNYFNILRYLDGVIGNSSSGIYEVPSFKIPTINLGTRQKGRIFAKSILNYQITTKNIILAIKKALSVKFKNSIKNVNNPYYKKNSRKKIISNILNLKIKDATEKKFYE